MAFRRVFILWANPLFHESVRLLLDHPEVECVGETSDYAAGSDQILHLHPDTVLVEEVEGWIPVDVFKLLEKSRWTIRVVGLNLWDNQMRAYQRVQHTVGKVDDLLDMILSDPK